MNAERGSAKWTLGALAVYAPHLLEEHVADMANDPIILAVTSPFMHVPVGEAMYATFQATLIFSLVMLALYAVGGWARMLVLAGLGVALLAEAHHLVRAALTLSWNAGLFTAAPMPLLGAALLSVVARRAVAERSVPASGAA